MNRSPESAETWLRVAAIAAAVQLLGLVLWYWRDAIPFSNASGVWIAHAWDFLHGELYRPLWDENGSGGSRYMPLFFIVLAGMIEFIGIPSTAGAILNLLIAFCFLLALIRLMERSRVPLTVSVPMAGLACFSISYQLLHLEVRGDLLASFLNLAGLGFAVQGFKKPSPATWVLMALCFLLAWLAKFTMVFGIAAVSLYLILNGRARAGCSLFLIFFSLAAFSWELLQAASNGNMEDAFLTCILGGGSWKYALLAPWWFLKASIMDPFFLMITGAAIWTLRVLKTLRGSFAELYFWITLAGTVALFTSPGVDTNHLIDLLAASLWVLARTWQIHSAPRYPTTLILPLLMLGTLFTWIPGVPSIADHLQQSGKPSFRHVEGIVQSLPWNDAPILSENPLIPILLGERPFMLDAFSLRVMAEKDPAITRSLFRQIQEKKFKGVILTHWQPVSRQFPLEGMARQKGWDGRAFYGNVHFPKQFLSVLKMNYKLAYVASPYYVFIPKNIPLPPHSMN